MRKLKVLKRVIPDKDAALLAWLRKKQNEAIKMRKIHYKAGDVAQAMRHMGGADAFFQVLSYLRKRNGRRKSKTKR